MIIAIDGPSASGKGTLAKKLATELNFAYLDTGKIYRAVGFNMLRQNKDLDDNFAALNMAKSLNYNDLDNAQLKNDDVAQAASKVAVMPDVRQALLEFQQNFAKKPPEGKTGVVLDGRDIGTVICPDAHIKLFISANVEIRAKRRHKELLEREEPSIYQQVLADLQERDERDSNRKQAPLKAADDAIIVDTSDMNILEVLDFALRVVSDKTNG